MRKDPSSRPSSQTAVAPPPHATVGRPRESLAASQTSRKSSWETETVDSSMRCSLSGAEDLRRDEADSSRKKAGARTLSTTSVEVFGDASYATPRKTSAAPAPGMILSPPSPPSSASTNQSFSDPNLSHFSHASFLSPLPSAPATDLSPALPKPSPLPLARTLATTRTRSRPRESASLEDILRLGLLNSQIRRQGSVLGPAGGAGDELELLLDEGSSRLMSEELASSIGAGDVEEGAGVEVGVRDGLGQKEGAMTPWRGRVVSLGGSATAARLASSPGAGLAASPSAAGEAGQAGGKVLLLRQSTTEASDLRRQVASLLAEVEQLKRTLTLRDVVHEDEEGEKKDRVEQLEQELEAAREREDDLRRDWEEERRAMEEDLAELAAAAAASDRHPPTSSTPPSTNDSAQLASLAAANRSLALSLHLSDTLCAVRQSNTLYDAVEARAKMERDEVKASLDGLRAIAMGLRAWEGALQAV